MNAQPIIVAPAYHDLPAYQRLRPWVLAGSIVLAVISAAMIITAWTSVGTGTSLWGIFIAGVLLLVSSLLGIYTSRTRRAGLAFVFFIVFAIAMLASIAVLIVNAAMLGDKMNNECQNRGFARYSHDCDHVRNYHIVVYTVFGPLVIFYGIPVLICAFYFWYLINAYGKQEHTAHDGRVVVPGRATL